MTHSDLRLVLAEGITPDQLRQLAAVMLGLVVFAAVFVLVERQRSRRGGDDLTPPRVEDLPSPPPVEYPPWTPSPPRESAAPLPREENIQDELPVPFVPRGHEPAPAAAPPTPPAAAAGAEVVAPEPEPPRVAPVEPPQPAAAPAADPGAASLPAEDAGEGSPPESPDEIGIIIPDESPGSEKPGKG